MQKTNVTARLFDSEVLNNSEKRLRTLLKSNYPKFNFLTLFEQKLGEAEHNQRKAQGKYRKKALPATKTIVAAVFGCKFFKDLAELAIPVDEHLSIIELNQRRVQQTSLLSAFILEKSPVLGLVPPQSLHQLCNKFIEMWQPTTCTYDELEQTIYHALEAKNTGKLPEWFNDLSPQLEKASWNAEILPKGLVYKALALLKVADEAALSPTIWNSYAWPSMRENLGIAATRLANTTEFSKTIRATNILKLLWESGIIYAGVQLARMYHDLLAPNRLDLQRADEVISQVLEQYEASPNPSGIFATSDSHAEFFMTYNTIKINVLREAQDPDHVFQLTQQILAVGTYAARLGFEGFATCVMSILAPDLPELQGQGNEDIFALREKISKYPLAEDFCKASAKLALANRQ